MNPWCPPRSARVRQGCAGPGRLEPVWLTGPSHDDPGPNPVRQAGAGERCGGDTPFAKPQAEDVLAVNRRQRLGIGNGMSGILLPEPGYRSVPPAFMDHRAARPLPS